MSRTEIATALAYVAEIGKLAFEVIEYANVGQHGYVYDRANEIESAADAVEEILCSLAKVMNHNERNALRDEGFAHLAR